jgi:protein-L-isoaspartate(D-aspartate) O-methyltransferase|tara:strand:+ start:665 stop:1345 length:681 start_codon:yes stop_codon:yes gene_type:complete
VELSNQLNLNGIGMTSQRTRERLLGRLVEQGIVNMQVLDVMRSTPRHIFLDEALSHRAYEDVALPIGHGQTISQPYVVARMTEIATNSGRLDSVLEIGTGCGYQTAVLSRIAKKVYTIERIKPLLERAKKNLKLLGIRNVEYRHEDGSLGWEEKAPFDAIITTAAPQNIPEELYQQLSPEGGSLVIPVGADNQQDLKHIVRSGQKIHTENLGSVRFVPLLTGQVQT